MTELQRWERRMITAANGKLEINRNQIKNAFPISDTEVIRLTKGLPFHRKEGTGKTRWYPTDLVARRFYENTEV